MVTLSGRKLMTLDSSAYCPGGTGKKIKNCACRDITGELQKILRAIEGKQRAAALDRINRVLATKANRPCLLALKSVTLLEMNDLQNLEDTVTTFVQVAPDNSLAHAFAALLEVRKNRSQAAVDCLQTAIDHAKEVFSSELYDAVGAVAEALAADNQYLAARGHLLFRAMIGDQDEDAVTALVSISAAQDVPTLLKRDLLFAESPSDVPWKQAFNAAAGQCLHGSWRSALTSFEELDREYPGESAILKNIATGAAIWAIPAPQRLGTPTGRARRSTLTRLSRRKQPPSCSISTRPARQLIW